METRTDYDLTENHVHVDGASGVFGKRVLPPLPSA